MRDGDPTIDATVFDEMPESTDSSDAFAPEFNQSELLGEHETNVLQVTVNSAPHKTDKRQYLVALFKCVKKAVVLVQYY